MTTPDAGMAVPHDYSGLQMKGNHRHDHFSLTVQNAARLLGVDVDYTTVFALSTNCFSPAMSPGENCKSWWMSCYGRDVCLPFVARALGLSVRPLTMDKSRFTPEPKGDNREEYRAWTKANWTPAWADQIRRAHDNGEVVVLWREWVSDTAHGFNCWAWWGIITGLDSDGQAVGASLNGFSDNPIHPWKCGIYALSRDGEPRLDECLPELPKLAAARIRGDVPPFTTYDPYQNYHAEIVFGVRAVHLWADAFAKVPFCSCCGPAGSGRESALTVAGGAEGASKFLRRRADATGGDPNLSKAARCYDLISELLAPYTLEAQESRYMSVMGDLARQAQHGEEIRSIAQHLTSAAEHLSRAM